MKVKKKNNDEDVFETFLIKEQELAYIERNHAQVCIKHMADEFKKHREQSTIKSKIKDYFYNIKEYHKLKKLVNNKKRKVEHLNKEEKSDKTLEHKIYKHRDFNTHIFFERKYTERTLIADCGGFHFPVIEYDVYIRVEYSIAEIWTRKHLKKTFESYEEATNYYLNLISEYKQKEGKKILDYLTKEIDEHCNILNQRISSFN